jgi:hypothetical protein
MDRDFFAEWLAGIGRLTAEQRSRGFRALILAEASDDANPISVEPGDRPGSAELSTAGSACGEPNGMSSLTRMLAAPAAPVAVRSDIVSLTAVS